MVTSSLPPLTALAEWESSGPLLDALLEGIPYQRTGVPLTIADQVLDPWAPLVAAAERLGIQASVPAA